MASMTIEQLIDIVQADLTFSGMLPKVLPDLEIRRLITEHALEWFYKNYFYSLIKTYYFLDSECMRSDIYTKYKYFILPEEVENIIRIIKIDDPSLFQIGIQAPHLSINLGVTNQPMLTSFVTTVGELGVYRSIISAFSDEINKMTKNTIKYDYNHIDKRLHLLSEVTTSLMLETYVRIEQEQLFDFHLFKDYVIGLSQIRLGEALSRFNAPMPGNFNYQADQIITGGQKIVDDVKEKINKMTQSNFFIMSR